MLRKSTRATTGATRSISYARSSSDELSPPPSPPSSPPKKRQRNTTNAKKSVKSSRSVLKTDIDIDDIPQRFNGT